MSERAAPALEVRLAGRTLRGVAIRYGERSLDRAETFEPGAFAPLGEVSLNLQHDPLRVIADTREGTLRVFDTAAALSIEADLREGSAELSLLRRRALRGLSVEFVAASERRRADGLRVIERAALPGIGLVDASSYRSQVELRQAFDDAWLTGEIRFGRPMSCRCSGPTCDRVEFQIGSLDVGRSTLAIGGSGYASVLGSLARGNVVIEESADAMRVGLTGPRDSEAARQIADAAAVAPVYLRPILDLDASEYSEAEGLRTFQRASVRAFLIKPTDASGGHVAVTIDGVETRRVRRRRVLL